MKTITNISGKEFIINTNKIIFCEKIIILNKNEIYYHIYFIDEIEIKVTTETMEEIKNHIAHKNNK